MFGRLALLTASVMLCATAGGALAQDTVKLVYKFTPNEVLRYQMVMDLNATVESDAPTAVQKLRLVGELHQKTLRVLPNGDAEVAYAFAYMKMGGQDVPQDQLRPVTMVVSPNGAVKKIGSLEHSGGPFGQIPFLNLNNLCQYTGILPLNPVKTGDTWNLEAPLPNTPQGESGGVLKVKGKLVSTKQKVKGVPVASFEQNIQGNVSMTSDAGGGQSVSTTGTVKADVANYFSPELGRMMLSKGTGSVKLSINVTGGASRPAKADVEVGWVIYPTPTE